MLDNFVITAANLSTLTTQMKMVGKGVNGWAEGLQAQLEIKASTLQDGDPGSVENGISYRTQSVVQLGIATVPSTLYCTDHCITQTSYDNATNAKFSLYSCY